MNKHILLALNVIFLLAMMTHGVHTGVKDQDGHSSSASMSSTTLNDDSPAMGEKRSPDQAALEVMLQVCSAAETAVPIPPADPDGPSTLIILASPALSDLIPLVAVHEPPTCPPDVHRAFLQVFRN